MYGRISSNTFRWILVVILIGNLVNLNSAIAQEITLPNSGRITSEPISIPSSSSIPSNLPSLSLPEVAPSSSGAAPSTPKARTNPQMIIYNTPGDMISSMFDPPAGATVIYGELSPGYKDINTKSDIQMVRTLIGGTKEAKAVEAILKYHPDITFKDFMGKTAPQTAESNGYADVCKALAAYAAGK